MQTLTIMRQQWSTMCFFPPIPQMATMVTFCLTAVYALSAMLRMREFYINQGKQLPKQDKRKTLRHVTTVAVYIISWYVYMYVFCFQTPITKSVLHVHVLLL